MPRTKAEKAQAAYEQTKKQKPAGAGSRFRAMVKVGKARGAKDPEAFANWLKRKRS